MNNNQPEKAVSINGINEFEAFLKKQLGRDDVKVLGVKPENGIYVDLRGNDNA